MAAREVEGTDLSRLEAFTDGVFAIAITLLVLSFEVPDGDRELARRIFEQWPNLLAYFLSFAVVGRLWIVHHRFFSALRRFDSRLMSLNLLYLSLVVLVPFTTELLGEHGDDTVAAATYATVLGLASLVNFAMVRHAMQAEHVEDDHRDATAPFGQREALLMPGVFLLSVPVAFLSPHAAEAIWIGLLVRPKRTRI